MNKIRSTENLPDDEWKKETGKRIASERKKKGWTQEYLAEKVERDTSTISSWEQGRTPPTFDSMVKLAKMFDCDLDYLVDRIDEKTHDIKTIHDMTGLSVGAIEKICREKATINGSPVPGPTVTTLSHLIEADGFRDFINAYMTFVVAADRLKKSAVSDETRSVIEMDKVILPPDMAARFFMQNAGQALINLCEAEYKDSCKTYRRNSRKANSYTKRRHE